VRRAHWLEANAELTFETTEFYLRDSEELVKAFAERPEPVASTLEIAERSSVALELGKQLPLARYSC